MLERNKLYLGDCLEVMKDIDDESIDMILCDLPFGTTSCKWDTIIPFESLWKHYNRIIKPNGAIVLNSAQPFTSALIMSNPKMFKYHWTWIKPKGTGHLNAKRQPMRNTEDICVFYKKQCLYKPQLTEGTPYNGKSAKISKISEAGNTTYGKFIDGNEVRTKNTGFRLPQTTLNFGVVERNTLHETQKPVPLCEYFIKTYTNEGDLILDNCAGSGTTGEACINTKRDFILIEKDEKSYNISKERLNL